MGHCACGEPVHIKKTGECRRCYQRRWQRERAERVLEQLCSRCQRRPATHVATGLCDSCTTVARRRKQAERDASRPVGYSTAHARVRHVRGPASAWRCVKCGKPAQQWAYSGGSPSEIVGLVRSGGRTRRMVWSPDPAAYEPMCRDCHGRRDHGDQYGNGYRSTPERRLAAQRRWSAAQYARETATPEGREAYRQRKRAERERRAGRRSSPPESPLSP